MNGLNMNQFVLGFALAGKLPQQDRLIFGLTASMFPSSNPMGAILLKPQIDKLASLESENSDLRAQIGSSDKLLEIARDNWSKRGTIAPGAPPEQSPEFKSPGSVTAFSSDPTAATIGFDTNTSRFTITRLLAADKAQDVVFTIRSGNREITVTRELTKAAATGAVFGSGTAVAPAPAPAPAPVPPL
jgi:hypothetical protein